MDRQRIGILGEEAASRYLVKKGYCIKERNYRLKCGELDIIAVAQDGCLVFVEVKTRKNTDYGYASEYVTLKKQQKLRNTALLYCQSDVYMRFDIIEVYYELCGNIMRVRKINHIEDAF